MTEYDFSPEAYDRYMQTQNRVANWVHQTEQHRQIFEAAAPGAPGIPPVLRQPSPPIQEHYIVPHRSSPAQDHRDRSSPLRERSVRDWSLPGQDQWQRRRGWPSPARESYKPRDWTPAVPRERYRHAPSPSSSENSYVHVAPPQIRRPNPPPPPIHAPPLPPSLPFLFNSQPSPRVIRPDGTRRSSSSSRRHYRSKSHSYPQPSPPPLVTPIYTSPGASSFTPPPPIIYNKPSQGYPFPPTARPVIPPREQYTTRNAPPLVEPTTPQTTPSTSTSSSEASTSAYHTSSPNSPASLASPHCSVPAPRQGPYTSGLGGSSHPYHPPQLHQEDQNQAFGQNSIQSIPQCGPLNTTVHTGLEPPYISRNLQYQQSNTNTQRYDGRSHPYRPYHQDQSRRSSKSSFQSQPGQSPTTLTRPQLHHGDLLYEEGPHQLNPSVTNNGVISISVPPAPRYSIDDRDGQLNSILPASSRTRTRQHHHHPPALVVHAPQPIKHPGLLSPRLRASARA